MVRIAQKVGKENYYNYLSKLGFGQYSHIELANEDD
jgi:cell division protein FtsI/penicillin-binding protein 2